MKTMKGKGCIAKSRLYGPTRCLTQSEFLYVYDLSLIQNHQPELQLFGRQQELPVNRRKHTIPAKDVAARKVSKRLLHVNDQGFYFFQRREPLKHAVPTPSLSSSPQPLQPAAHPS